MTTQKNPLIRLHSIVPYDRGAKVRWLLTELGLEFETRWLNREEKEFEKPDFLRLNPMGRVPVLEMGDQVVFESGAICAYLADLYLEKGMAPQLDSADRTEYQKWMYFASSTVDTFQSRIMIIEDIPAGNIQEEKQKVLQDDLRDAMTALDQALEKKSYLVANRFSAADICVSYHLTWLRLWPELDSVMQDFPRVLNYVDRLKNTPSALKAEVFSYKG